ncbi:hypothetical protein BDQ17DRAFT_1338711 [Cyathus striatus]|nr:hypothetical protein BDQ17DRAFT_1338711 [Cyathus striatus]
MSSQDAFNYAIGVLACLSALVSVVLYYQTYLPITQMKALDELLNDTRNLYMRAKEDGVLPHGIAFTGNLEELELESDELREQAYKATTQLEEYSALLQGLSRKIMRTAGSVKRFRAYVIDILHRQLVKSKGVSREDLAVLLLHIDVQWPPA